jgi:cytochrome o ubiquinol oxidase subunit II
MVASSPMGRYASRCTRLLGVVTSCVVLCSCQEGVLDPHGPVGSAEREILYNATAIMLAVVVPVILMALGFAWWFRAGNQRAQYRPDWAYSGRIELIVWSIPALVVLFLGGMAWISAHELDPPRPLSSAVEPLEIEVIALDWRWLFIFPKQGIASIDRIVIPTGVPVHFWLTSTSVMNSFFIPQLGSQIYAMPGMTTQLNLQADEPGTYRGLSAQFSGPGFSDMRFVLAADSQAAFDTWVSQVRQQGATLDRTVFSDLSRPSRGAETSTYGTVQEDPFGMISHGQLSTHWSPDEAR